MGYIVWTPKFLLLSEAVYWVCMDQLWGGPCEGLKLEKFMEDCLQQEGPHTATACSKGRVC